MSLRLLLIITAPDPKCDRFVPGSEWSDAWRFEEKFVFSYRTTTTVQPTFCDDARGVEKLSEGEAIIIWVNTQKVKEQNFDLKEVITTFTSSLNVEPIGVAYHDVQIDFIPENLRKMARRYNLMTGNEGRFAAILKHDDRGAYLDAKAEFNKIVQCFFLEPWEIVTFLKHRIAHLFLPFDIDFQALQEITDEGKQKQYAEEVIKEYGARRNKQSKVYPLLQLLADLHFFVAKADGITLNNGTKVSKSLSLSDADLPDGKCLKELIKKAKLEDDRLKDLRKNWGFVENTWELNPEASAVRFLKALDETKDSSDKFRVALQQKIDGQNFHNWFTSWFLQLEEVLEQLEEKLQ